MGSELKKAKRSGDVDVDDVVLSLDGFWGVWSSAEVEKGSSRQLRRH